MTSMAPLESRVEDDARSVHYRYVTDVEDTETVDYQAGPDIAADVIVGLIVAGGGFVMGLLVSAIWGA